MSGIRRPAADPLLSGAAPGGRRVPRHLPRGSQSTGRGPPPPDLLDHAVTGAGCDNRDVPASAPADDADRSVPGDASRRPRRRALLTATGGALLAAGAAACGQVRLGSPPRYTRPAEGIDDIYRTELLRQLGALETLTAAAPGAAASGTDLSGPIRELHTAVAQHREALLTGAQADAEASGSATSSATAAAPAAADPGAILAAIGPLLRLGAEACVQCSGSLARVVAAIGAHLAWAASRLVSAAADPALAMPAVPTEGDIRPTRTVPRSDPPSVAARVDYQAALQEAQKDEWFFGYVQEVRAARATDPAVRAPLQAAADDHRGRAKRLTEMATADKIAPVAQEPVYPLPAGGLDEAALVALTPQDGPGLVADWVALTGAAPFAGRAFAVATALAQAVALGPVGASVPALPSLAPKAG